MLFIHLCGGVCASVWVWACIRGWEGVYLHVRIITIEFLLLSECIPISISFMWVPSLMLLITSEFSLDPDACLDLSCLPELCARFVDCM